MPKPCSISRSLHRSETEIQPCFGKTGGFLGDQLKNWHQPCSPLSGNEQRRRGQYMRPSVIRLVRDIAGGLSVPAIVDYLQLWDALAEVHLQENQPDARMCISGHHPPRVLTLHNQPTRGSLLGQPSSSRVSMCGRPRCPYGVRSLSGWRAPKMLDSGSFGKARSAAPRPLPAVRPSGRDNRPHPGELHLLPANLVCCTTKVWSATAATIPG